MGLSLLGLLATLPLWAQNTASAVVNTPQVRATLMAHAPQGLASGQTAWLGLQLQHQPGWHTYWRNPGDSGLPTQLQWQLPQGIATGDMRWPVPHMIQVGPLVNHGFEGTVLLAVPLKVEQTPKTSTVEVRLQADWLVCQQECIPQSGQFLLRLNTAASTASDRDAFEALLAQQPTLIKPPVQVAALDGHRLQLRIQGLPSALHGLPLKAYAEEPEVLASGLGLSQAGQWVEGEWRMDAPLHRMRSTEPRQLGLWLTDESSQPARAWRVNLKVTGDWPTDPPPPNPTTTQTNPAKTEDATASVGWVSLLLGAFVGGLLLNLMPCVLPVLAIKLLSVAQSSASPASRRGIGLAYAGGVLGSMLLLAALVMGFRAAGSQLGWGFQLQSPWLVAGLSLLFLLIALNLWDVLAWPGGWGTRWAAQKALHPIADACWSGVLAVVVAAPCTAPFMGASVGVALTLPPWQGIWVFVSLGAGLALPFTLGSWVPAATRWLPRPGAWMQTLRHSLAFPMLLTVVWLVWVLGQQTRSELAFLWLACLTLIAGALWARGQAGRLGLGVSLAFVLTLMGVVWLGLSLGHSTAIAPSREGQAPIGWQAWSAAKVSQTLQAGQPVFIDFTAAWCVTCQVNKQTTLRDPAVLKAFAEHKVVLFEADWTRQDPAISQALNALGRSGVPVYVLQFPGRPPQVLPELLTPGLVQAALSQ